MHTWRSSCALSSVNKEGRGETNKRAWRKQNWQRGKNYDIRLNKKRSLLRLTWLKFLRAGGRVFFFLLKFFIHKSGMPTSTFQKQGTVTPVAPIHVDYVAITSIRPKNVVARVAQAARVCRTVDHVTVCNEIESTVSSFFGSSSAWSVQQWWEERHCAGVFSY